MDYDPLGLPHYTVAERHLQWRRQRLEYGTGGNRMDDQSGYMKQRGSDRPPFMSGRLDDVALPELIQMLASGGHTSRIELTATDGQRGTVTIEKGTVGRCRFGELLAEDAFYALCRIGGRFSVYRTDPEQLHRATVARGWQELLLEAARLEDEERRDSNVYPFPGPERAPSERAPSAGPLGPLDLLTPSEPPPRVSGPPASTTHVKLPPPPRAPSEPASMEAEEEPAEEDRFDALFADATRAYLRRELDRAEALFTECASIRPNDRRVKANLKRLAEKKGRR